MLSRESFEFQSPKRGCRVSPSDLRRVSLATRFRAPQAASADEAIFFTEKTTAGRKVTLQTDVGHLFVLRKYLSQKPYGSPAASEIRHADWNFRRRCEGCDIAVYPTGH